MTGDDITIGARLRELRLWRHMTLAEVAGLAGVTPAYLSMAERGLRPLDRRSIISALAAALRVSETELTGGPHLGTDPQHAVRRSSDGRHVRVIVAATARELAAKLAAAETAEA